MLWFKRKPTPWELVNLLEIKSTQLLVKQKLEQIDNADKDEQFYIHLMVCQILNTSTCLSKHIRKQLSFLDPDAYSAQDIKQLEASPIPDIFTLKIHAKVLTSQDAISQVEKIIQIGTENRMNCDQDKTKKRITIFLIGTVIVLAATAILMLHDAQKDLIPIKVLQAKDYIYTGEVLVPDGLKASGIKIYVRKENVDQYLTTDNYHEYLGYYFNRDIGEHEDITLQDLTTVK